MKLFWTPPAEADVDALVRYIARDDIGAALRTEDRIVEAVDRLVEMPLLGRTGRWGDSRELIVPRTPYLVMYRIRDDAIELLRVLHGAQQWPPSEP